VDAAAEAVVEEAAVVPSNPATKVRPPKSWKRAAWRTSANPSWSVGGRWPTGCRILTPASTWKTSARLAKWTRFSAKYPRFTLPSKWIPVSSPRAFNPRTRSTLERTNCYRWCDLPIRTAVVVVAADAVEVDAEVDRREGVEEVVVAEEEE